MPYNVSLLTSTGLVIEHQIPVAVVTPTDDGASMGRMALLGVMIGIVPVLLGMTVLPVLRRSGPTTARVLLAVTVGLLGFLAVDAALDGFEVAAATGGAFGGVDPRRPGRRPGVPRAGRRRQPAPGEPGIRLALLIAVGIGLHNLSEGLAVGSAFAVGELALGATLVAGFAAHNTTEGIAVIAPLTDHPVGLSRLLGLGLVAGAPAILGAVVGLHGHLPGQRRVPARPGHRRHRPGHRQDRAAAAAGFPARSGRSHPRRPRRRRAPHVPDRAARRDLNAAPLRAESLPGDFASAVNATAA